MEWPREQMLKKFLGLQVVSNYNSGTLKNDFLSSLLDSGTMNSVPTASLFSSFEQTLLDSLPLLHRAACPVKSIDATLKAYTIYFLSQGKKSVLRQLN